MKVYKIILSNLAKSDLQNIVSYLTNTESSATAKYVEHGILSAMKRLKYFPAAYPQDEFAGTDKIEIRFLIKWSYKILFFIEADTVQIVGIFHTAQNPEKLMGEME
ncbi:MAG: type II toxin-antitoxin system RelE/ParE family toxin [Flavobacteriaceae bacterium]|jgi:plasmid stabilization system protein ParE|nr:type II toxin-antitoxin system RelE/ParE family toxin [Flavobacteriaceae bacterium]